MTDETFPHEIWADLDHWIEGPAASDLRAQGYMKYIRADRIEELEAKLAKAVEALSDLADCVDLGCFCSEMEQATVMDKARATLAELTGGKDE